MSEWNFDMNAAPRGKLKTVRRRIGEREVDVTEHVPDLIIAAGNCGVVTLSKWLPDQGRWNMFTKSTPPIAWHPWPEHPEPPK